MCAVSGPESYRSSSGIISATGVPCVKLWRTGRIRAETLTCDQRRTLLEIMPPRYGYEELVKLVVGGDLDMYRVLLAQGRLRDFHLAPLERSSTRGGQVGNKTCLQRFGDAWVDKAKVAMDLGYTPGEVLAAIHSGGWGWSGNIS